MLQRILHSKIKQCLCVFCGKRKNIKNIKNEKNEKMKKYISILLTIVVANVAMAQDNISPSSFYAGVTVIKSGEHGHGLLDNH